jgi:hypothetical protein
MATERPKGNKKLKPFTIRRMSRSCPTKNHTKRIENNDYKIKMFIYFYFFQ